MTNSEIEYLAKHKARLIPEGSATRLIVGDKDVLFENQTPQSIRPLVNQAIEFVGTYFIDNRNQSLEEIEISEQHIEQVAIAVALKFLYMYNLWKDYAPEHRDRDLTVAAEDLQHPYTRDEVLFYCEKSFPSDYQSVAASLLGITREEFTEWELSRREFWEMR